MAAIIAAVATALQAIFAGLVFWFIVKQYGISKTLKDINKQQAKVIEKQALFSSRFIGH